MYEMAGRLGAVVYFQPQAPLWHSFFPLGEIKHELVQKGFRA